VWTLNTSPCVTAGSHKDLRPFAPNREQRTSRRTITRVRSSPWISKRAPRSGNITFLREPTRGTRTVTTRGMEGITRRSNERAISRKTRTGNQRLVSGIRAESRRRPHQISRIAGKMKISIGHPHQHRRGGDGGCVCAEERRGHDSLNAPFHEPTESDLPLPLEKITVPR
jgi:hypothetical protein